jgi:hypothetical protein
MDEQKPNSVPNTHENTGNSVQPSIIQPDRPIDSSVVNKKSIFPNSLKLALLIFGLASGVVLAMFPRLDTLGGDTPSYWVFVGAGFIMVAFTTLLFTILGQLKLGFGASALVLALGYNSVIAIIKFALSPAALYLANQKGSFSTLTADPNSIYFTILTSVLILFFYVGVFALIYKAFVRKLNNQKVSDDAKNNFDKVFSNKKLYLSLYFVVGIIGLAIYGLGIIALPLIEVGSTLTYLGYVFTAFGLPLIAAIGAGIFLAYRSFKHVSEQVVVTGNTALLASFFWLGVSLIVIYHVLWVIFMLTLIHIWPFKTYTPK